MGDCLRKPFSTNKAVWLFLLLAVTAVVVLLFPILFYEDPVHTVSHLVYTDDYPSLYADELKMIFGDHTLSERTEKHIEGEVCSCGYHQDEIDYYEWTVTYSDACGQTMQCRLNNYESLPSQLLDWLEDQIGTHFYTNYVERYFEGRLMEAGSYCFCFIGHVCLGWSNEKERMHVETCIAWKENARANGSLISLASLDYAEIFDLYPIELSINVKLDDKDFDPDRWASNYDESVPLLNEMAARMSDEIGDGLNLDAVLYSNAACLPQAKNTVIFYLRGQLTQTDDIEFEHAVFNSYRGKFW